MTRRTPAPLAWLAGLLVLYLAAPFVAGLPQVYLADWSSLDVRALVRACAISVTSATLATLLIALGGIPLGYLLARTSGRLVHVLGFLVQLPLALPPLTSGILLLFLVGYQSPLGRLTGGGLTDSFTGIVLAEIFVAAPFLIIAARSAFSSIDPVLEGVAATLGRKPLEVFTRVTLPIAWPWLLSGMLLSWLRAFGEFGATVMVAYHPYSLPVYTYVAFGSQGLPAMLPVLLPTLVLALGIMVLSGALGPAERDGPQGLPAHSGRVLTAARVGMTRGSVSDSSAPELALRVHKRLGAFDLHVAWSSKARRLAILGPSGSGKTLTLKMIAGLTSCDASSIRVAGRELCGLEPAERAVAYVPQNYALFPNLTVAEQLRFPAGAAPQAASYWIERLELQDLVQRKVGTLSLGQQQRVALARALVRPAQLLLFDEPFSALDAPLRARLRREMRDLQSELAGLSLIVTHDPQEAALLADELLILDAGRVLQAGPTSEVFRRPVNETAARLLGAEQSASGLASGESEIDLGDGVRVVVDGPALERGTKVGWSFPASRGRLNATGAYAGVIECEHVVGAEQQATVRVGHTSVRVMSGRAEVRPGLACRFDIDPEAVQIWPARDG